MCNGRATCNSNTRDDFTGGCFRNLLLVTGPQLLFAKVLAPILSYVELLKPNLAVTCCCLKPYT